AACRAGKQSSTSRQEGVVSIRWVSRQHVSATALEEFRSPLGGQLLPHVDGAGGGKTGARAGLAGSGRVPSDAVETKHASGPIQRLQALGHGAHFAKGSRAADAHRGPPTRPLLD